MSISPILHSADGFASSLPPDDGISNGFLETMRCQSGRFPLWQYHRDRLLRCSGIELRQLAAIEKALTEVATRCRGWEPAARVRLRYGNLAGRSYWDITAVPLEASTPWASGVALVPCKTRLPVTRQSQGCKLLDRAVYQQAAEELTASPPACEGLLLSEAGALVETLRCNLLLHRAGQWWTPSLDQCGVRGVMRAWLQERLPIREVTLRVDDLSDADELVLCNSVRGVIPVTSVSGNCWTPQSGSSTDSPVLQIQRLIAQELW